MLNAALRRIYPGPPTPALA